MRALMERLDVWITLFALAWYFQLTLRRYWREWIQPIVFGPGDDYVTQNGEGQSDQNSFDTSNRTEPNTVRPVPMPEQGITSSVQVPASNETLSVLARLEMAGAVNRTAVYTALGLKRGSSPEYHRVKGILDNLLVDMRNEPNYTTPIAGRPTRSEYFQQ